MRAFERTFPVSRDTRILDVGGSPYIWQFVSVRPQLTLLNLPSALAPADGYATQVAGDGRMLPFADGTFDIVFSNSVIEHVGGIEDQQNFADEVRRVGRAYWVQTPDRSAPVEMHLMLPFVHLLPKSVQGWIVSRFTVWEILVRPSAEERRAYLNHCLHELRLIDSRSLKLLFPDGVVLKERLLGIPKSIVAIRRG